MSGKCMPVTASPNWMHYMLFGYMSCRVAMCYRTLGQNSLTLLSICWHNKVSKPVIRWQVLRMKLSRRKRLSWRRRCLKLLLNRHCASGLLIRKLGCQRAVRVHWPNRAAWPPQLSLTCQSWPSANQSLTKKGGGSLRGPANVSHRAFMT